MSIYKACDIRGRAGTELTPDQYHRWGHALGLQVAPRTKFVLGGDVRQSTPEYLAALAEGGLAERSEYMQIVDFREERGFNAALDLLALAEVERPDAQLRLEPLDLRALMLRQAAALRDTATRNGIALSVMEGEPVWIEGDRVRLTGEAGQTVEVCIVAAKKDELPEGILFIAYGDISSRMMVGDTHGSGMPTSKGMEVTMELVQKA